MSGLLIILGCAALLAVVVLPGLVAGFARAVIDMDTCFREPRKQDDVTTPTVVTESDNSEPHEDR